MKIILPLGGEDIGDHFHNIYHRMLKTNESVITHFNGITAVLFPDDAGFEHARYPDKPYRQSTNLNSVVSYYMRELERKEPSGYTEVRKVYDKYDNESREAREKIKRVQAIIDALEKAEQGHMTAPTISAIRMHLRFAIK